MSQLLSLSRAARLVGVTRGVLQKKIHRGELTTFEGQLKVTDLLRAYPDTQMENTVMLERVERIKADARYTTSSESPLLPSPEVLEARLIKLSQEFIKLRAYFDKYTEFVDTISQKLAEVVNISDNKLLHTEIQSLSEWLIKEKQQPITDERAQLLIKDTFLRLIAAHVKLIPSGHEFFVQGNDSILEAAMRVGLAVNYGCTGGNCGLCKARLLSGEVRKIRHHDYVLSETEKNMNYVLLCSNTAITDLVVEAAEASSVAEIPLQKINAKIKEIVTLAEDLMLLHVQTPRSQTLRFIAGQTVTLTTAGGISADYSIASCPCDGRNLQFYIRKLSINQQFADTVFTKLKNRQDITVEGPKGNFILKEDSAAPALFLAYNDGIAPIRSLIEHALALDTVESVHLYWIVSHEGGHYLHNLCRTWADALDNFYYHPLVGNVDKVTEITPADVDRMEVYVVGSVDFVTFARDMLFKQGLPSAQLHQLIEGI